MLEKNRLTEYQQAKAKCDVYISTIKPFLEAFSREHDCGTDFYKDITVLSGPSVSGYNYFKEHYKELFELSNRPSKPDDKYSVDVYNIKFAGVTFVLVYEKTFAPNDVYHVAPKQKIVDSFMLYRDQQYPVASFVAESIKALYREQEHCSVLYSAHSAEIEALKNTQR